MRATLLLVLLLIGAVVGVSPAFAADTDTENSTIGGTIPELCQIRFAGGVSDLLDLNQDGDGEAAYDAGFVTSTATATVLTLDANTAWELSVNYVGAGWAANGLYTKANTDLLIQITNTPAFGGNPNGYVGAYVSPPAAAGVENMLEDAAIGVHDLPVHIQTKVLLDWTKDIPGTYSTTLVYTLAATIP
jgi:hypothetical protein